MPFWRGFPLSGSGASLVRKSPANATSPSVLSYQVFNLGPIPSITASTPVLEPLDVPLYGLDVPLGVYVVIRVQDGSGELGGGEELWEQLSLRVVLKARYSLHIFGLHRVLSDFI